ncbi:MAG: hypothetical protein ACI9YP_000593 [Colwellia sp.]|jgi:hypothetical protein
MVGAYRPKMREIDKLCLVRAHFCRLHETGYLAMQLKAKALLVECINTD